MKKLLIIAISFFVFSMSWAAISETTPEPNWQQLAQEYPIKPHHRALKFDCVMCHSEATPDDYEPLETEQCLDCHGSSQKVANRLKFMDVNHTNPHNSFHDGLDLDCYECHAEHEPSVNLCTRCHEVGNWMSTVK